MKDSSRLGLLANCPIIADLAQAPSCARSAYANYLNETRPAAIAHKHPGPRLIGVAWCLGIIAWSLLIALLRSSRAPRLTTPPRSVVTARRIEDKRPTAARRDGACCRASSTGQPGAWASLDHPRRARSPRRQLIICSWLALTGRLDHFWFRVVREQTYRTDACGPRDKACWPWGRRHQSSSACT